MGDVKVLEDAYVGNHDPHTEWRISPLRAPHHRDLPPTLVQVAGHDSLRDEGKKYAEALRSAGVPVVLTEYESMPHGYINFPYFSRDAKRAMAEIVAQQKKYLKNN
jgi:acetyl esterase